MKHNAHTQSPSRSLDRLRTLMLAAGSIVFAAAASAAPMDATTLADFDFSAAQQTRTQTLIDNGTLQLERVLTAPDTGYRHMGWPVATRLPDGRTVVLIRHLRDHSGYASHPDNARRVIWSDDNMATWQPADVLETPPPFGRNPDDTPTKYDYQGMQAISWAYPSGTSAPRLVAVTAQQDDNLKTARSRVYLSDDRGATWREQAGALSAMPTTAVHSGPNMVRHPEFGLVVPFGQQTGGGTGKSSYLASSTNAGETWQIRTWANSADSRSIEPALATWGPGHMVMIGRERTNAYGYDSASGKYYYTQHVYAHTPGAAFSDVSFTTARTNIAGNGKTPTAKGKNAYEAHDTADIIYNPVTGRIEMIQSSRWGRGAEDPMPSDPTDADTVTNSLNIWSIDPVDLLAGETTWRFDGNIVERQGIILGGAAGTFGAKGNKDGYHPGGSIVDETAGRQHIFVYVGIYTQYASAYRISRPLDTYAFRAACGLPVLPAPAITTVSDVDANNVVTITGANFNDLKEVLIAGKPAAIVNSSATEIKINILSGVSVGDKIAVRTDNGLTSTTSTMSHSAPDVSGISYQAIWAGNTVTITGANLDIVNKVFFGGTEVTAFVSKTDTQIVVTVPAGVTDGVLSVQAPGGSATAPGGGSYVVAVKPFDLEPLVDTQPVVIGYHPLDLTASATGTPVPTYKWQCRGGDSGDWTDVIGSADYQGANTAHLTIVNTTGKNGWQYRYTAMNHTEDVSSNAVTLQLLAETFIAPAGIVGALDADPSDLYISDAHAIYVVTQSDQKALVFAGHPDESGSADGSSETARFNAPRGLALDSAGRLIVADTGNSSIRAIVPSGTVSTLATVFKHPRDVAAHGVNGDIYVADTGNHMIKKINAEGAVSIIAGVGVAGFANGIGPEAQFNTPSGIAVDLSGNLYVADTGNHTIRYIDMTSGSVSTFAGRPGVPGTANGPVVQTGTLSTATLNSPESVAVDNITGRVYVADTGNHRIRVIYSGSVFSVAGQFPGIAGFKDDTQSLNLTVGDGWLDRPSAITASGSRTFYIADTGNTVIRRYSAIGTGKITTLPIEALPETSGTTPPPAPNPDSGGGGGGALSWWFAAALGVLASIRTSAKKRR